MITGSDLPGADQVNPLGAGPSVPNEDFSTSGANAETQLQQGDTNAVVSPTHNDFMLTRIAGGFVALPIAVVWVWVLGL